MEKDKLELVKTVEEKGEKDSLTELLRMGAKKLISQAVEAELEEMLEELDAQPVTVNFADAFGGHRTPVPFFEGDLDRQPNPYFRSPAFRSRTGHIDPGVAGDGLHGKLCQKLEDMGNGCELYALEARSIVSSAARTPST